MGARAFATYVMDRLDGSCDYLAGHAESAIGITVDRDGKSQFFYAYPRGEERQAINVAFDNLVAELKRDRHITHDERPASVIGRLKEARAAGHEQKAADTSIKPRVAEPAL
jgi:hypothetical protein